MGRIRTIKPEFFTHEALFDAERETGLPLRLAFAGLWTQSDREGRFLWRPRMLKTAIMPYDEVDFGRVLDALLTRGFLVRYVVEDREVGCIPSWHRHQVINNRETASNLAPPPEGAQQFDASSTRGARVEHAASGEGKGKEGKEDAPNGALSAPLVPTLPKPSKQRNEYPADFEETWKAYPTHRGMSKAEALPQWRKLSAEERGKVLPSIAGYRAFLHSKPDLEVQHFCRYLSKRRFEGFAAAPEHTVVEADWRRRLIFARDQKVWASADWGPLPGEQGCLVPPELLLVGDGDGWVERSRAA